jgi:hypothetical protein
VSLGFDDVLLSDRNPVLSIAWHDRSSARTFPRQAAGRIDMGQGQDGFRSG